MIAVDAEMELAFEMLSDAELMYKEGRKRSAVNRAYYAMFHATKAVLLYLGTDCQSHGGAINRLGEYAVKKGIMDEGFSKSLQRSYRLREKSDYHPITKIEDDDVEKVMKESKEFVIEAKKLLSNLKDKEAGGR